MNILSTVSLTGYEIIFAIAIMIIIGHVFGKIAEKIKLPEVTGFIIAGILISLIVGLFNKDLMHSIVTKSEVVSTVALGFLSFTLGTKMFLPKMKKNLKLILIVLVFQLVLVVGFTVLLFSLVFPDKLWLALLIGGISAATASAPVIEITKKFQAKGPLTSTLMPLIGFDNVLGTLTFLITTVVAAALKQNESITFGSFLPSLQGIGLSILIGLVFGALLIILDRKVLCKYCGEEKYESYLVVTVGIVLLVVLGAQVLGKYIGLSVSPFVAPLILGIMFTNSLTKEEFKYESHIINGFTPPLITVFFVLAGAELDVLSIHKFGLYAILYVIAHAGGKFLGAFIGTRIHRNTDSNVKKYLPTATLTQGGFEIFLAAYVSALYVDDPDAKNILSIVLTAVLIFEFFAPLLLTKSLFKAGEATLTEDDLCAVVE